MTAWGPKNACSPSSKKKPSGLSRPSRTSPSAKPSWKRRPRGQSSSKRGSTRSRDRDPGRWPGASRQSSTRSRDRGRSECLGRATPPARTDCRMAKSTRFSTNPVETVTAVRLTDPSGHVAECSLSITGCRAPTAIRGRCEWWRSSGRLPIADTASRSFPITCWSGRRTTRSCGIWAWRWSVRPITRWSPTTSSGAAAILSWRSSAGRTSQRAT